LAGTAAAGSCWPPQRPFSRLRRWCPGRYQHYHRMLTTRVSKARHGTTAVLVACKTYSIYESRTGDFSSLLAESDTTPSLQSSRYTPLLRCNPTSNSTLRRYDLDDLRSQTNFSRSSKMITEHQKILLVRYFTADLGGWIQGEGVHVTSRSLHWRSKDICWCVISVDGTGCYGSEQRRWTGIPRS
jgi:hypothetical protein